MRLAILVLAVLAALSEPAVAAQCRRDELYELTQLTVDFSEDHATLAIASSDMFHAIRFKAEGGPVTVTILRVEFLDGPAFSQDTALVVRDRLWSDPVAFPGDAPHFIKSVTLSYKAMRAGQSHATLHLWGQQTVPVPGSSGC